ncbi:hypothetical protein IAD21_03251 [Abditibacteriota bacterium]|nr:hypothetical protein IAD21_03251 [Abditibacteriota bacterium]
MPSLSESAIRAACGKRIWDRAEELLEWPALSSLSVCGEDDSVELFGRCHGSQGELYALRVRVQNGAVAESSCSCAYDGGGVCKHRVALLLVFTRQNEKFRAYPAIVEMIAACSHETLRDLVATMVRRSPDLLSLIAVSRDSGDEPVRETLRRALSGRNADDGRPVLERLFGQASQHEAQGDWFAAGELWSVALEELAHAAVKFEQVYERELEFQEGYYDEEVNFGEEWASMALQGLERAFEQDTLAPEARHSWLRSLWEAERAVKSLQYFSLPSLVRDLLSSFAPADLWADIEASVRADLKRAPRQPDWQASVFRGGGLELRQVPAGDDWERAHNVNFLLGRLYAQGRDREAQALIAEVGTSKQQFELKIRQGDFLGAQILARQVYNSTPHQLLECATQLDKAGASELALQLVLEAQKSGDVRGEYLPSHYEATWRVWLCDFYLRYGRATEARAEAVRLFAKEPKSDQFDRLKRAVELQSDWQSQRDSIEQDLRSHAGKNWQGGSRADEVALELVLCERDAPRIYSLFKKLAKSERHRRLEAVANAIEAEMPEQSLALWRELAEWIIEHRDQNSARRSYAHAAQALMHVRDLYKKLGSVDEWTDYRQTLLGVYKSLRALPDEMKKAGV